MSLIDDDTNSIQVDDANNTVRRCHFQYQTLENREQKEIFFLPLSKIESGKRIFCCHSRKSRVEREMKTMKFRDRETNFSFCSGFFYRERDLIWTHLHDFSSIIKHFGYKELGARSSKKTPHFLKSSILNDSFIKIFDKISIL